MVLNVGETNQLERPEIRYRNGDGHDGILFVFEQVEHQSLVAVESRHISRAPLERSLHYLDHLVVLPLLGIEGIVGVRSVEDDHVVVVAVDELTEELHLLHGHHQRLQLSYLIAVGIFLFKIEDAALGILLFDEIGECLERGVNENVSCIKRCSDVLAIASHPHGGVDRAVNFEDVLTVALRLGDDIGERLLLPGLRANDEPMEVNFASLLRVMDGLHENVISFPFMTIA